MTKADLPPPGTTRWVPRRKARVVAAVEGGLITRAEAARLYSISDEEFDSWRAALSSFGMRGLRVTQLRRHRIRPE
jgi:transposase-like protein